MCFTIKGDNWDALFFRIMPLFRLRKTLTFCNISVITGYVYLKLGVCVCYPKSKLYYEGRQFKMHFFRIMCLFLT